MDEKDPLEVNGDAPAEQERTPVVSSNTLEDMELLRQARTGSEKAFERLLKKYRKSVYYMLLKMVNNPDDAEDLTQEAFAKAFAAIHKFDATFAFSTWLFRIATNNAIDFIRKRRIQTISLSSGYENDDGDNIQFDVRDENHNPGEIILRQQRANALNKAIANLPEKYRQLVDLRYFQELSYEEIAAELNLPLGTVKAQLFRSRELLIDQLGKFEDQL